MSNEKDIIEKIINRPEGYKKERADCTVVALSLVLNISYIEAHTTLKENGRKNNKGFRCKKNIAKVFSSRGIEVKQVKRSGSVISLLKKYPQGRLFCIKRAHAFAVIDGIAHNLNASEHSHIKGAWLVKG